MKLTKKEVYLYDIEDDDMQHSGSRELDYNHKFYLSQDGHAITEPMTAADIVARFGPIREIEANGFRVVSA